MGNGILKRVFGRALCIVGAGFFALLLAEGWIEWRNFREARAFTHQVHPFYSWSIEDTQGRAISRRGGILRLKLDPEVGYRNVPNQQTEYFQIDARGARGPRAALKNPTRILLTGGSFAFGTGLNSDQETFAAQIAQRVPTPAVVNAAVIGFASAQEDLIQREWLSHQQFELVISAGGWNDFHFFYRGLEAALAVHGESMSQLEQQLQVSYALSDFNPLRRGFSMVRHGIFPGLDQGVRQSSEPQAFPTDVGPIVEEYLRRLGYMAERCAQRKIPFILVLQPDNNAMSVRQGVSIADADIAHFAKMYLAFVDAVRDRAMHAGVTVLDLNAYREQLPGKYFMDSIHLDAQGNAAVAELLSSEVRKVLALGGHPAQVLQP